MASSVVGVLSYISDEPSLSGRKRLLLHEIQNDTSFNQKYIKCKINKRYALYTDGTCKRMKLILEEEEQEEDGEEEEAGKGSQPQHRINLFLTGAFAEDFIQVNDADIVIISQAMIKKSSSFKRDGVHPCQIEVDSSKTKPSVWVIPAKTKKPPETQVTANPRRRNKTSPRTRLFPETTTGPASSIIRSTSNGEEGSSSGAGPSTRTTSAPPDSSMSAVTGRNVGDQTSSRAGPSTTATTSAPPDSSSQSAVTGGNAGDLSNVTTTGRAMDAWTVPKGSPSKRSYTYTLLKDLKMTPKVNIFGVVKFFKPPYKTKGPDYCMMVTLIDPSLDDDHRGLRCQLFREEVKALPQIHSIGDIVRFHRLKITEFNGNVQGQKGDGFQCLVFDGGLSEAVEPRASTSSFTMTDEDTKRVKELRLWSTRCTQLTLDNPYCTLERCYSGQYFDLACQVISVAVLPTEACVVVKVWDGTKMRGLKRVMDISQATVVNEKQSLADRAEGLSVDVSLYDNHMESGKLLKPGQFIKLCNLHVVNWREPGQDDKGMIELVLHRGTSYGRGVILLRPDKEKQVKDMIKRMEEIAKNAQRSNSSEAAAIQTASTATTNQSTSGTRPAGSPGRQARTGTPNICMQRAASVINYHFQQKISCLRDVVQSDSPNKFRIRAKVSDYLPNDTIDFVHLRCSVCKFRCRVPSTINTKPIQSLRASEKGKAKKGEIDQRQSTSLQDGDRLMDNGGGRGVQTRSTAQRSPRFRNTKSNIGMVTRSRHSEETGDSSSMEGSPRRPANPRRRRSRARKRPASENERPARSDQRENLAGTSTSTKESEKRIMVTTSHGVNITAEIPSSSEDEGGVEGSERRKKNPVRKKIRVEVDKLTLTQALLLNRLGMTLVSHADLPTGLDKEGRDPGLGDQVFYVCPKCAPSDDKNPEAAVPDDAPLLQYRYCMKLILDDGTGSIEVIVDGQHGDTFFRGIPVANLYTSQETKFMLEETMAKLCPFPIGQGFNSPDEDDNMAIGEYLTHPWLECCILSYTVHMGSKEVVKYKIFDTSLALDVE